MSEQSEHFEQTAVRWLPLLNDLKEAPYVAAKVMQDGGTRPVWDVRSKDEQTMLLAWPEASLLRAGVIVSGPQDGQLEALSVMPFMEGFPNPLTVVDTHAWENGKEGEVLAQPADEADPIWFYDPLFFRDVQTDLTPGVTQVFYLAGLCHNIRRALLDELTVTSGPNYEAHAQVWLEANPGKTRLDVPPLRISLRGVRVLGPTPRIGEYQARGRIFDVDSFLFGPEGAEIKIYRFGITFGQTEHPIHFILYAPERICHKGYVPEEGHEVDIIFWMQGRVVDAGDEAPDLVDEGATPEAGGEEQ